MRIYANSASSVGYDVYAVTDTTCPLRYTPGVLRKTETGITLRQAQGSAYSNAPAMGTQLGSSGMISANTWTTVDVTSYIMGDGVYNLAFSTTSSTNITLRLRREKLRLRSGQGSREGANAPELVIETSGGPTNTPGAANTPGPSLIPLSVGLRARCPYGLTLPGFFGTGHGSERSKDHIPPSSFIRSRRSGSFPTSHWSWDRSS